MDGDKGLIKTPSKEEASVGAMLPVTPVSGVMEKKTPLTEESIEEEYNALSLNFGGDSGKEESFTEDTGEMTMIFATHSKKYIEAIKAAKKLLKNKKYRESIRNARKAYEAMEKCLDELYAMDPGIFDMVIDNIIQSVRLSLEVSLAGLLTLGIGAIYIDIKTAIATIIGLVDSLSRGDQPLSASFNYYRSELIGDAKLMMRLAESIESKAEKLEAQKSSKIELSKNSSMVMEDASDSFEESVSESEIDVISRNISTLTAMNGMSWFENVCDEVSEDSENHCIFESGEEENLYMEDGEKKDIDADLKSIIKKLNDKGYKTKYSCSGHPSAISKTDIYRDGVKNGKLYSTARIVFAKIYDFPNIPKYWEKRILDEDKTAIYVKPPHFRIINGLPKDQFENWKNRYMYNLEKWVDELPDESDTKKDENSDVTLESAMDEMLTEMQIDCMD